MRASTVSGIHGALGDNGQTYKTLLAMWSNRHSNYSFSGSIVHGCGGTTEAEAEVLPLVAN